jgi:pimeloyl-ACP methyl ester carboxylesterase
MSVIAGPARHSPPRFLLRWLLRLGLALVALLLAAISVGLLLGPAPPDPALATRAPPAPAIDTAPGSGRPTLILLHGAGLNAHMWDPVIRALDPRWRVIAIDLPGHGARRGEFYSLAQARIAVADAARRAAPAPVLLVGDSLGGYSAMAAASALPPGQLRGLVVAGASADFPARLPLKDWGQRLLVRWLLATRDRGQLARAAMDRFGVAPRDARAMLAAGVDLAAVEPAVDAISGVDFLPVLRAIPQPVLVANGEQDSGRVAQEAEFVAAAPQATHYTFRNAGHGVSMLRPVEFAAMVDRFASEVMP